MVVVLAIAGGILLFFAIRWRLNQIEKQALVKAARGAPDSSRRAPARPKSGAKASPSALKAAGNDPTLAKILQASGAAVGTDAAGRTDRVLMKIPIEVSAQDHHGRAFTEKSTTQLIHRQTATLMLRHVILPGAPMTIKNVRSGQTCRFRARQSGPELPGGLHEWTVEYLDVMPDFWGISFDSAQGGDDQTVGSLLECSGCHCREMLKLTLPEYSVMVKAHSARRPCKWCEKETDWKFVLVEEDTGTSAAAQPAPAADDEDSDRRRDERRIARMTVAIRHQDGREEQTVTENVSRTGICCAAQMDLVSGDRVFLRLVSDRGTGQAEFRALVMWRRRMTDAGGILYGMRMERQAPGAAAVN